jgi:hypothetical protein
MRFQLAMRKHAIALKAGVDPDQPRDELGQWTDAGGGEEDEEADDDDGIATDISAAERPGGILGAARAAWKLIDAFRKATDVPDFFDRISSDRTVAVSNIGGEDIFGSSSKWPSYTDADDRDATQMRDILIDKHPDVMNTQNIGQAPNNALFHAESNILMRAARKYDGSLAGKEFDVYVDRPMCNSCRKVLPLLSRELGNPTVRFIDKSGTMLMLRGGSWVD